MPRQNKEILQNIKIVLVPTYIKYRNSEIGNSDSDFATGTPYFFPMFFRRNFVEFRNRKQKFRFRTPQRGVRFQQNSQPSNVVQWYTLINNTPEDEMGWHDWTPLMRCNNGDKTMPMLRTVLEEITRRLFWHAKLSFAHTSVDRAQQPNRHQSLFLPAIIKEQSIGATLQHRRRHVSQNHCVIEHVLAERMGGRGDWHLTLLNFCKLGHRLLVQVV